jgi:hypothetical protein
VPPRAGRGYPLADAEYYSCRSLAHAIAHEWAAVGAALQSTDLSAWVGRAVGDTNMANTVAAAIAWGGGEASRMGDGSLAGRLCTALDPKGPLRFRSVATAIEGLGPMLSGMIRDPEGQRTFAQLAVSDLPLYWISNRYGDGVESRTLVQTVDRLRFLLKRTQPGSGIERCLYELNPSQPCLSPALESHYVADADALLPALEAVAASADRPSFPIDRHIAAFIAARFREASETHLEAVGNRSEPAKAVLGALRTLAVMQWKLGPPQLPRLTAWLGKLAEALVDSYHANALRKQLQEHLQRVIKKGSLIELLNFVDDTSQRERDNRGYREALTAFAAAEAEIDRLSAEGIVLERRAEKLASQIASVVSTAVAVGTVAVLLMVGHG